jgi:competence protein ComFC
MTKNIFFNLTKTDAFSKNNCLSCKLPLRRTSWFSKVICEQCAAKIPWITSMDCLICGRAEGCTDCIRRQAEQQNHLLRNRSAARYSAHMKSWLAQYKFRGDERWSELMTDMIWLIWQREYMTNIDIITCVPISAERTTERTFNQSERIAKRLAIRTTLPFVTLLRKIRNDDKQSKRNREQRLLALKGSVVIDPLGLQIVQDLIVVSKKRMRVLIIDDVYTTGSTLHECANVVSSALHAESYGLTWARS